MKKWFSLALAIAMCLSLAACGKDGAGSSGGTQDQSGAGSSGGTSAGQISRAPPS